jgi:hypothetical protein
VLQLQVPITSQPQCAAVRANWSRAVSSDLLVMVGSRSGLGVPEDMGEHDVSELIDGALVTPFVLAPPSPRAVEKPLCLAGAVAVGVLQCGLPLSVVSPVSWPDNRIR